MCCARILILIISVVTGFSTVAQDYELLGSAELYSELKKISTGLRVLYIAAHPDDENTRLITWLEKHEHIETAYLSLTRGEGGQNLIGQEQGDALGVLRTYELLEARKIDGGDQFFTRAIDFGYSKSAEESFKKWGKQEVLADVVLAIRRFRPHVIITRFAADGTGGHGHHTASAVLAQEAFDLAGDSNAFPEQLAVFQVWQPQRLFQNTSSWWRKEIETKTLEELKSEKIHRVNIGVFDPISGMSINEIASLARSKHRCQAFGSTRARGEQYEYLQLIKGEWSESPFEALIGDWRRSPDYKAAIDDLIKNYSFTDRHQNLENWMKYVDPKFMQRNIWADAPEQSRIEQRANFIRQQLMGVRIEVFADKDLVVTNRQYKVNFQVYNSGITDVSVSFSQPEVDTMLTVKSGQQVEFRRIFTSPKEPSQPFWLKDEKSGLLYGHQDFKYRNSPKLDDIRLRFSIKGETYALGEAEIHRKWSDRSLGESVQPLVFVPFAGVSISPDRVLTTSRGDANPVFTINAFEDLSKISLISNWDGESNKTSVLLDYRLNSGQSNSFPMKWEDGRPSYNIDINYAVKVNDEISFLGVSFIEYDHVPIVPILKKADIHYETANLGEIHGKILYIPGSGDAVDESLENIGYTVDRIKLSELAQEDLMRYKCVITGVRAFNTNDDLATHFDMLKSYMEYGGNLIVQYNTTYDLKVPSVAPYDLKIGRGRVTEEDAVVTFLEPTHPVFSKNVALCEDDWSGWVQERGLYFAESWDKEHLRPLIAWHDTGDDPQPGGLLYGEYGKGTYYYTGISFFRELPAGVTGAYRLLVNMIETSKNQSANAGKQ